MTASYKVCMELYDDITAKNPCFKKQTNSYMKYRDEVVPWFTVAENHYDIFSPSVVRSERETK